MRVKQAKKVGECNEFVGSKGGNVWLPRRVSEAVCACMCVCVCVCLDVVFLKKNSGSKYKQCTIFNTVLRIAIQIWLLFLDP